MRSSINPQPNFCPNCGVPLYTENAGGRSCRGCGLHITDDGHRYTRRQQRYSLLLLIVIDLIIVLVAWLVDGQH